MPQMQPLVGAGLPVSSTHSHISTKWSHSKILFPRPYPCKNGTPLPSPTSHSWFRLCRGASRDMSEIVKLQVDLVSGRPPGSATGSAALADDVTCGMMWIVQLCWRIERLAFCRYASESKIQKLLLAAADWNTCARDRHLLMLSMWVVSCHTQTDYKNAHLKQVVLRVYLNYWEINSQLVVQPLSKLFDIPCAYRRYHDNDCRAGLPTSGALEVVPSMYWFLSSSGTHWHQTAGNA